MTRCVVHFSWATVALLSACAAGFADDQPQIAFPGAEGFGRFAQGGRGGDVYHVTSLDDDGPGSLRDGIRTANGPRTIVFDVSGTIELKSPLTIDKSHLTLAGQSAPGDGICIKDQTFRIKKASHIVIRYMRFRLGDENKPRPSGPDCLNTDDVDHIILDHITVTWGIDGNHDLRRGGNFTLQWSIYAEALNESLHEKGSHAMLASFRDLTASITLHHNLFASSRERHPTLGGSKSTKPDAIADFRNNVVYNVSGATNLANCKVNMIENVYIPGPNTPQGARPIATKTENKGACGVFMADNVFVGRDDLTEHNLQAIDVVRWAKGNYLTVTLDQIQSDREYEVGLARPQTDPAMVAYERVLAEAGASHPRDAADARLVDGVIHRTHRLIDSQREVGGWPVLKSAEPPIDTDRDGMSDDWEREHSLDPLNPDDRNSDRNSDGFTNLEEYLNALCPPLVSE